MNERNYTTPILILVAALVIGVGTKLYAHKLAKEPPPVAQAVITLEPSTRAQNEYATIRLSSQNENVFNLTGLSLVQDTFLVHIPSAVKTFIRGEIGVVRPVVGTPPMTVILSSGRSPIGVSFRENKCSGFLEEYQDFVPPLQTKCPAITELLARQNITIPAQCQEYFEALPSCIALPQDAPSECRAILASHAQYNQCVGTFENDTDFNQNSWRLYLNSEMPLWSATSSIQLLDTDGSLLGISAPHNP